MNDLLLQLKNDNVKYVYLNGFKENLDYVLSLDINNIKHTGETKSFCGYYTFNTFDGK